MQVLGGDDRVEQSRRARRDGDDRQQGDESHERAGEEIDAEHRRVPVRRQRHDPVDRGERLRQGEDDDRRAGQTAQPRGHGRISGLVLAARPAEIQHRDAGPDQKVERRPRDEERHVQIRRFPLQQRIAFGGPRHGPRVEIAQAEQQREEERRHHRQRRERRLADAPQDDSPSSLGRVLDQHEEQRAERQAEEEQERHEPREQELLGISNAHDRAGHRPDHRDRRGDRRNAVP